jgi:hypothetical protein
MEVGKNVGVNVDVRFEGGEADFDTGWWRKKKSIGLGVVLLMITLVWPVEWQRDEL